MTVTQDASSDTTADASRTPAWLPRALAMAVLAVMLGVLVWRGFGKLGTVFTIVVISWFISLAMEPTVRSLVRRGVRRTWATGLVMLASLLGIAAVLALSGGLFVSQLVELVRDLPSVYENLIDMVEERFGVIVPPSDELISRTATSWGSVATGVLGVGGSILGGLFVASAVLLVVYYMVSAGPRFRASVCKLLAPKHQHEVLRVWEVTQEKVSDFINSRMVLAAFSTVFTFIFLTVVGVPYALPLAAFTGVVSQFVPTIGTYIGAILPVAVALSVSPLTALYVLVFMVVYQQFENLILAPKVSARALELNPAISFLAVLTFGSLFGALGAFLALPVAATIQALSGTYVQRHELVESEYLDSDSRSNRAGAGMTGTAGSTTTAVTTTTEATTARAGADDGAASGSGSDGWAGGDGGGQPGL